MLENNWFGNAGLDELLNRDFTEGSFFKTLSRRYLIEITGSDQELRAEKADDRLAQLLKISAGAPVLHISIRFGTSRSALNIYSELYCNTARYPIGNRYHP